MATKKLGTLIKEARTNAGFTQESLARKIPGLSASDISKAERGEKDLTQEQLKSIARATGVTQKSLLEAAGRKTTTTSKTSGKTGTSGRTGTSGKTSTGTSMKVSATEKKLVELYRNATTENKRKAIEVLKGEHVEGSEILGNLLEDALGHFMGRDGE